MTAIGWASSCCATAGGCRQVCWGVTRRRVAGLARASSCPTSSRPSTTYLPRVDHVDRRIEVLERRARPRRRRRPVARAGRAAALPARDRHADRARPGRRGRRLQPLQDRRAVHELRRAGPLRALLRRAPPPGLDHQGRQQPRPPAARRGRLAPAPAPDASATKLAAPPPRPGPARARARLALPAAPAPPLAADGRTRQTASEDRRRLRPRARRVRLGDRHRPAAQERPERPPTEPPGWRSGAPTTRRTLAASMRHPPRPATRDARPRQLPTDTSHAVPTRECQSDPPSLPRDARHPTLATPSATARRALTFRSMSVERPRGCRSRAP